MKREGGVWFYATRRFRVVGECPLWSVQWIQAGTFEEARRAMLNRGIR